MSYTNGLDKPSDYFVTKLYTGTGSEQSITGVGFQPDWVWTKSRSNTLNHNVYDSVRGVNKGLKPNTTDSEFNDAQSLKSFNSDGFTVGTDSHINTSSATFASWNWKAGTSFTNDASSTGIGTIDSVGSVNQDAGFSICSYTGTGSAGTIKHGLNSTPNWILLKNRIDGSLYWYNYLTVLGNNTELYLNAIDAAPSSTGAWNTTSPTSSVFSVGSHGGTNASGQATIAYCFSEKQGYSKFSSYIGNGNADGTFVYTGFKPAFVMVKNTAINENWSMHDQKRNENVSPNFARLTADDSQAEATNTTFAKVELFSNGFKLGNSADVINDSGVKFIYMAFAENPFVTSTGVPATAR